MDYLIILAILKRDHDFEDIQGRDNRYYWVGIKLMDFAPFELKNHP
jgi:hypothetical protein